MNMEIYLTDNIRLKNDNMEYRCKNDKFKPITKNNWHLKLYEYGWEKLPKKWITKLNKFSDIKNKNSPYGVLDCGGDGDCLFHCIAQSLNERDINKNIYYNSCDIRNMISDNITLKQYDLLINFYRIMKDSNDFDEEWDPYSINSYEDFKKQIKISGDEYWGDYLLLQILIETLELNIFVLNCNEFDNDYSVYNTLNDYNSSNDSIFLLYENNCHFKLIGYFNDKIISYFTNDTIPYELKRLYNLD